MRTERHRAFTEAFIFVSTVIRDRNAANRAFMGLLLIRKNYFDIFLSNK